MSTLTIKLEGSKRFTGFTDEQLEAMRIQQAVENEWLSRQGKTGAEHAFTSTGSKLAFQEEAMKKFSETGYATPIVSHIMPTDVCNFQCSFCSVGNRTEDGTKPDALSFDQIEKYVETLADRGLRAVIFSGGGEPTVYHDKARGKRFRDLVTLMADHELQVGLITNGTRLDDLSDVMDKVTWARVSLYPSEYGLDKLRVNEPMPDTVTLGFSLVVAQNIRVGGPRSGYEISFDEDTLVDHYSRHLDEIVPFVEERGGQYLRLTPDCHVHGKDFILLHKVADRLSRRFGGPVFHQHKSHGTPKNCFLGFFHPVLYSNGLVYPCDSNILNDDKDRRFKPEYASARWDTVAELYDKPAQSLIDTGRMCPRCVFVGNNAELESFRNGGYLGKPSGKTPGHVNFI